MDPAPSTVSNRLNGSKLRHRSLIGGRTPTVLGGHMRSISVANNNKNIRNRSNCGEINFP